jgi:hypothetical protein
MHSEPEQDHDRAAERGRREHAPKLARECDELAEQMLSIAHPKELVAHKSNVYKHDSLNVLVYNERLRECQIEGHIGGCTLL